MFRKSTKEEIFFDLYIKAADCACRAAEILLDIVKNFKDVPKKVKLIEDIEHECDLHMHNILEVLNKSFITPIDREDICLIAKELDDITDNIELTAHRVTMFNVTKIRSESLKLAELILTGTKELKNVLIEFKNMKNNSKLKEKIIEVNRIENEGDMIFRNAVASLFTTESDAIEVIKWKTIFEYLEDTLDSCENVANTIEGVAMKHA